MRNINTTGSSGYDGQYQEPYYGHERQEVGAGLEPPLAGHVRSGAEYGCHDSNDDEPLPHRPCGTSLPQLFQPFGHQSKPLALSAICIATPAGAVLVTVALMALLPNAPLHFDRLLLLVATMGGAYAPAAGMTAVFLTVERWAGIKRGGKGLGNLLIDAEARSLMATAIQPRLAASMIATTFAVLPGIAPNIILGLGLYVGAMSAASDMADRQLRAHGAAPRTGEVAA